MNTNARTWLLLVATLPTSGATARMRLWRGIKALGCAALRDGAYLLPEGSERATALAELAGQTNTDGGQAWVVNLAARSADDDAAFHALFSRAEEYSDFAGRLAQARKVLSSQRPAEIAKTLKRLRKDLEAIQGIDFFPNEASLAVQTAWADFQEAVDTILSPDEPHTEIRPIPRLTRTDYQGRTWATRRHLWVDRVASAWLIKRFIDSEAKFLWLDSPPHCPPDALGFDFDGAAFTHVGDKVTFEVLLESFDLEKDRGLSQIAALVHFLDVGGAARPEATGFEAILSGTRERLRDDDELLREFGHVLDSLHRHYSKEPAT